VDFRWTSVSADFRLIFSSVDFRWTSVSADFRQIFSSVDFQQNSIARPNPVSFRPYSPTPKYSINFTIFIHSTLLSQNSAKKMELSQSRLTKEPVQQSNLESNIESLIDSHGIINSLQSLLITKFALSAIKPLSNNSLCKCNHTG
jgi:hypothetical protein